MPLTSEQQAAVDLVTGPSPPRVCCLTGGPGTGKTHTLRAIIQRLAEQRRTVALAAPSGKAAQRMEEMTGADAKTLHRLLCILPGQYEAEPLYQDVVIVDEASMIDVELCAALFSACFDGGQVRTLLLVGDPAQLPPVGPGRPFHDLIELSGTHVPVVNLTVIKRQGAGSGIALAAAAIRDGIQPEWAEDFELVECGDASEVPFRVFATLQARGIDPAAAQVLAPQKNHACGVDSLNAYMEEQRRPMNPGEVLVREKYREGTKVIHTKNDYEMEIFNGEIGTVIEATAGVKPRGDQLVVRIAEKTQTYRGSQIKMLKPAWALTVHKSQGSEWSDVIVVAHPSHTYMLTRSLLYVAITRARHRVVIVGTAEAVARAVRRVKDVRRLTMLGVWRKEVVA